MNAAAELNSEPSMSDATQGAPILIEVKNREEAVRLETWQARGVDADTQMFCLATNRLEQIAEANAAKHRHVLVSSFPKSGSTYLQKVLCAVTGFRPYWMNTAGGDTERNLELTAIPMLLAQDTVTQEHMRATAANVLWLKRIGVRPVVLVRNIFDVIVSSRDHSSGGDIRGPSSHAPLRYNEWTADEQTWFIIRMGLPWYFTFFASWQDAQRELPVLWITYEDAVQRTSETVQRILTHACVDHDAADVERRVAEVNLENVRFNRGVSGRGEQELTATQLQAVRDLASAYRGAYDFSIIGL